MRRSCHVRLSQADMYRSPTLLMHLRRWCSSQVIIIKDIQHLRASLIMVYMDFEALMKNSLPLWVYCVCTNCGDGVRQDCPPLDRLLQDVVMENKKIRFGEKSRAGYGEVSGQGCLCRRWAPFNQTKLGCWQGRQCEFTWLCICTFVLLCVCVG